MQERHMFLLNWSRNYTRDMLRARLALQAALVVANDSLGCSLSSESVRAHAVCLYSVA